MLKKRIIFLSVIGGVCFWVLDALLDYLNKGFGLSFLELLFFDAPAHEFYVRPAGLVLFVVFGTIAGAYADRSRRFEERCHLILQNGSDAIVLSKYSPSAGAQPLVEINESACKLLGYEKEELLRLSFSDLLHPANLPDLPPLFRNGRVGERVLFETALATKNGSMVPVEINLVVIDLFGEAAHLSFIRDLTERRQTRRELLEKERSLHELTSRLFSTQESERNRIAMRLHDGFGQELTLLKYGLLSVNGRGDVQELLPALSRMIEEVRTLSRELSPSILKELGLTCALEYLMNEFGEHHQIGWGPTQVDAVDDLFTEEVQTHIFRVFQESLANVGKHSRASRVSASIRNMGDHVAFSIEDNGEGFEIGKARHRPPGIGIPAMEERMRLIGGSMSIESRKGGGTRVSFTVPAISKG